MLIPSVNMAYVCLCEFQITLVFSKQLLHFSNYWQFKCVNESDKVYTHIYIHTHTCKHILLGLPSPLSFISIQVPYEDASNHSQQKVLFRVKWSQTNCPKMLALFLLSHSQWYACLDVHNIQCNLIGSCKQKSKKNLDLILKLKTPSNSSKRPFIKTNLEKHLVL